jgi:hypothetical protein
MSLDTGRNQGYDGRIWVIGGLVVGESVVKVHGAGDQQVRSEVPAANCLPIL